MGNETSIPSRTVRTTTRRIVKSNKHRHRHNVQQHVRRQKHKIYPQTQTQIETQIPNNNLTHLINVVTKMSPQDQQNLKQTADPYEILNISQDASLSEIKKAYRKLSSRVHPDKGGNTFLFNLVKDAYDKAKRNSEYNSYKTGEEHNYKMSQPVSNTAYNPALEGVTNRQPVYLNPKDFDQDKFNQVFSDNRPLNPYDKGYKTERMKTKQQEQVNIDRSITSTSQMFDSNKLEHLNNTNETALATKQQVGDILEYGDQNIYGPRALLSTQHIATTANKSRQTLQFEELGVNEINDFTNKDGTDYLRAHSGQVFNPNRVVHKRQEYTSIDELKQARSKNIELTPEEQLRLKEFEDLEKQKELERRRNEDLNRQMWTEHYNRMNQLVIKN